MPNVCFVTGTRAEFGLMRTTLHAIQKHRKLNLQLIATGMHLSAKHGKTINEIRREGWTIDATVPWSATSNQADLAAATGSAVSRLARAFDTLKTDIVLIVGDRVEAFAAATAGHLSGKIVAHIHGGDRAMGLVDDSLRHAITKLAHVHFPATEQSAERILKLGEDAWRIVLAGAPGIDEIAKLAAPRKVIRSKFCLTDRFALLVLHPADAEESLESQRARLVYEAMAQAADQPIVIVYPNNDPGSFGITRTWDSLAKQANVRLLKNVRREHFLGLLRDAAVLVGNSSSGIIEAASFGTPVIDIGPRQLGREHGPNVQHVDYDKSAIARAAGRYLREGYHIRFAPANPYGGHDTGKKIADALSRLIIYARLRQKLIAY